MQLGLHFRLTDEQIAPVLAAAGDDALLTVLTTYEEDPTVFTLACETDKA